MDFNKIEVDKKIILDYVKNNKLELHELKCYSNLYHNYDFVINLLKKNDDIYDVLMDYENKIYTVNGKVMTENQKVDYELRRLDKKLVQLKDNMTSSEFDSISDEIIVLKRIYADYIRNNDKTTLHYIKKSISLLQARLGLKNYFLLSAYDVFLEKYMDLFVNNKKYKLENNKK